MKSDIDIKDDIYDFIKNSSLAQAVTGKICKTGVRPKSSDLEDIVLSVIGNLNGQLQEAIVNVNVYVEDEIREDGQNQEATIRLRELCQKAAETLDVGNGKDFRFVLDSQRVIAIDDAKLHVINNKLVYKQLNE